MCHPQDVRRPVAGRGSGTAAQVQALCAAIAHALAHADELHARAAAPGHVWFFRACRCGAVCDQALPERVAAQVAVSWSRVHSSPTCGPQRRDAAIELLMERGARG